MAKSENVNVLVFVVQLTMTTRISFLFSFFGRIFMKQNTYAAIVLNGIIGEKRVEIASKSTLTASYN